MPILMFLSGMLLPRSMRKPPGLYIIGKLRHIGWPYVVWTIVTLVFLFFGSQLAGSGSFTPRRLLQILLDPTTFTWYLAYLILFYLLALALPDRFRGFFIPATFIICAIVHDGDGWSRLTYLLGFFLLGDLVMRKRKKLSRVRKYQFFVPFCGVIAAIWLGLSAVRVIHRYEVIGAIGVLCTIVILIPCMSRLYPTRVGRIFAGVGRDSLIYYVTHWPIVTAGVHIANKLGVDNWWILFLALTTSGLLVPFGVVILKRRYPVVDALYAWPTPPGERSGSRANSSGDGYQQPGVSEAECAAPAEGAQREEQVVPGDGRPQRAIEESNAMPTVGEAPPQIQGPMSQTRPTSPARW